jgi:hypothetical protein
MYNFPSRELEQRYFGLWRGGEDDDILRQFKCLRIKLVNDFQSFCDHEVLWMHKMCKDAQAH